MATQHTFLGWSRLPFLRFLSQNIRKLFSQGEKWIGFFGALANIYLFTHFFSASLERKRLEDYTLTEENFAKMRERNSKKPENQ